MRASRRGRRASARCRLRGVMREMLYALSCRFRFCFKKFQEMILLRYAPRDEREPDDEDISI